MRINNYGKTAAGVVAGGVLLLLVVAAAWHFIAGMAYISTDDAYIDGRIHAVAAKVGGTVLKVFIADNQAVKKGDVLVALDPADHEVKVKEARAALAAEQARLAEADARIKGAEAALEVQGATLKQAMVDKARAGRLFAQGVLPKEKMEKADTACDLAKAQYAASEQGVAQARAAKELEQALIATRQASVEAAELNLSYTKVVASSDGFVTKRSVEEGNMVQPGQPLMAVVALDDIWVTANYKETQLGAVRPGQGVDIMVDMYPHKVFKGKVESVMAGTGSAFSLFPPENALGNYVKVVQRIPVKVVL